MLEVSVPCEACHALVSFGQGKRRACGVKVSAVVLWLAYQAVVAVLLPIGVFTGLWGKGLVAILMVRGIIAAIRAHAFRRRLRHA